MLSQFLFEQRDPQRKERRVFFWKIKRGSGLESLLEINTSRRGALIGEDSKNVRDGWDKTRKRLNPWLMAGWTPEGCLVELTKDQGPWKTTIDAAGVVETRRGESEVERSFRGAAEAAGIGRVGDAGAAAGSHYPVYSEAWRERIAWK
jgi:hypothetical protein